MRAQQRDGLRKKAGGDKFALVAWTAGPLLTAAAATVSYALRSSFPKAELFLLVTAICFAIATIVIQVAKTIRDETLKTEEGDTVRVATTEALQQLVDDLAELPALSPSRQKQFVRTATQAAAEALQTLVVSRVPKARVNVFHLEGNGTKLVPRGRAGRGTKADAFLKSTEEGAEVIAFVAAGKPRLWEDLSVEAPKHWKPKLTRHYQTFIAAPIRADDPDNSEYSVYGMITLDAPRPHELTIVEQHNVTLVADLMAVAFSISENSQPGLSRTGSRAGTV